MNLAPKLCTLFARRRSDVEGVDICAEAFGRWRWPAVRQRQRRGSAPSPEESFQQRSSSLGRSGLNESAAMSADL